MRGSHCLQLCIPLNPPGSKGQFTETVLVKPQGDKTNKDINGWGEQFIGEVAVQKREGDERQWGGSNQDALNTCVKLLKNRIKQNGKKN